MAEGQVLHECIFCSTAVEYHLGSGLEEAIPCSRRYRAVDTGGCLGGTTAIFQAVVEAALAVGREEELDEVQVQIDLFFALAEKRWALVGLEALGMSLEDIFITIVDQTSSRSRYERKKTTTGKRNEAEIEVAKKMANRKSVLEVPEKEADTQTETVTETKNEVEKKYSALFGDDEDKK